jgi:hypothetical protein
MRYTNLLFTRVANKEWGKYVIGLKFSDNKNDYCIHH